MRALADVVSPYYRDSGGFSPVRLPIAVAASLLTAIVLGALYAYIDLYNPLVSYLTVLMTFGFGVGVGAFTALALRWAQVRNGALTAVAAAVAAFVGLYANWVFWVYAVVQGGGPTGGLTPWDFVVSPDLLFNTILRINQIGAWSFGGHSGPHDTSTRVTGGMAWLFWAAEAAMVLGVSVVTTLRLGSSLPYCETCGKWCSLEGELMKINPGDPRELREALERRDFDVAIRFGIIPDYSLNGFTLILHQCEQCKKLNTLTVAHIVTTVPRTGDPKTKSRVVIDKLLIRPDEVERLRGVRGGANVHASPAPKTT